MESSTRSHITQAKRHGIRHRLSAYGWSLTVGLVLLTMWGALLLRGLDLGIWGDVLAYEYHYEAFGVTGGISWLINHHWHRHLLGAIWSAPLHIIVPGQSGWWWASSFGLHFLAGFTVFLLFDNILKQQWRIVSFAATLLFAVDALQVWPHFEFGTNGHRNGAFMLALLSMLAYQIYVRGNRKGFAWLGSSILLFFVSMMSYEQNQLFFLAYPLLAAFEDHDNGRSLNLRWLLQVAEDLFLLPTFVVLYVFLLRILYPASGNLSPTVASLTTQIMNAIQMLVSPAWWWARISPTLQPESLLLTIGLCGLGFMLLILVAQRSATTATTESYANTTRLWRAVIFGVALAALTILGVAPTNFSILYSPRLLYAAIPGTALAGMAILMWAVTHLPRPVGLTLLILPAILIGTGASLATSEHTTRLACNQSREAFKAAMLDTVPTFTGDTPPYILLISDAHPTDDLCLNAQDINYPYMFALLYDMTSTSGDAIYADALYFDVPDSQRPDPDIPSEDYTGQYIIVDEDGIYSPLRPDVVIDLSGLVVAQYDSVVQQVTVLDQLPAEVIAEANIENRIPFQWETNHSLIGQ